MLKWGHRRDWRRTLKLVQFVHWNVHQYILNLPFHLYVWTCWDWSSCWEIIQLHWLAWFTVIEDTANICLFVLVDKAPVSLQSVSFALWHFCFRTDWEHLNPAPSSMALKSQLDIKMVFWYNYHILPVYFQSLWHQSCKILFGCMFVSW